jgi:molecular chaperone HtpG
MITIPSKLLRKISADPEVGAYVASCLTAFEPWVSSNQMAFFPEYTDHGPKHIQQVMETSEWLIPDDSFDRISAADAGILVLAILLHDCALHLTEEGFHVILEGSWGKPEGGGESEWPQLWNEFLAEALRYDDRKLKAIFGDVTPVRRPPALAADYTQKDRLLIGEFIRRFHGCLAKCIATHGVPSRAVHPLKFPEPISKLSYFPNLAGLIAESHGADLRDSIRRFSDYYDPREFCRIHAVYLMCVLRTADYLQIQSERAPETLLRIRTLGSSISRREWSVHSSVRDIRHTHDDPEAIYIEATPASALVYFRLKEWLRGIQYELDVSWAVMGETYGRIPELSSLKLRIRRVRSSIDDIKRLQRMVPFALKHARFKAADSDLLKLLVSPLYGDRPDVGIRELLQNSIDAVRERASLSQIEKGVGHDNGIVVTLSKGADGCFLEIADSGLGMNLKILTEYFLTAGSSFRKSDEWKEKFQDASGRSRVLRAGRFGVGALAAFLLGDRIYVSTRRYSESDGYSFEAGIEDEILELRLCERPVGTTIKIKLENQVYEDLKSAEASAEQRGYPVQGTWDWFCLDEPKVIRVIDGNVRRRKHTVPSAHAQLPKGWHRIRHPDFEDIHWHYTNSPGLICNGLIVSNDAPKLWTNSDDVNVPKLSIFDPDGKLPINLQRTGLTRADLPFNELLFTDVVRTLIANSFAALPTDDAKELNLANWTSSASCAPFVSRTMWWGVEATWLITPAGFTFFDPYLVSKLSIPSILALRCNPSQPIKLESFQFKGALAAIEGRWGVTDADRYFRGCLDALHNSDSYSNRTSLFSIVRRAGAVGVRIALPLDVFERARGPAKLPKFYQTRIKVEHKSESIVVVRYGECESPSPDFQTAQAAMEFDGSKWVAVEYYIKRSDVPAENTALGKCWERLFPDMVIPKDMLLREQALARADQSVAIRYKELKDSVETDLQDDEEQMPHESPKNMIE